MKLFTLLLTFCFMVFPEAGFPAKKVSANQGSETQKETLKNITNKLNIIHEQLINLKSKDNKNTVDLELLKVQLLKNKVLIEKNTDLVKSNELQISNDFNSKLEEIKIFESNSSLLLTCVAVIVTAMGVIIAILAFWGFSNIKTSAISASIESSKLNIEEAISSGAFNDSIDRAIAYVAYRDVMAEEATLSSDQWNVNEDEEDL